MKGSQQAPGERAIRVLVADSSRIHTFLVADALRLDPLLDVIPFEADSSEIVAAVKAQKIDVLVISSSLDERSSRGFEVLHELRGAHLSTRAVILPDSSRDEAVLKAFRGGARGVFSKSEPIEQLSKCVRCVHQGQIWANSQALRVAVEALASSPTVRAVNADGMKLLSDRELQVVHCIAEGLTNREIAERLKLSQHTIKNYLFRIFDKVGVSSRVELLFMTLSQTGEGQALLRGTSKASVNNGECSNQESTLFKEAAESGLPAAQLALAQLYLDRGKDPEDFVNAYMWYLVATERAFNARGSIANLMTPEQIEEAKQKASVWLSKLMQTSPLPAVGTTRPATYTPISDQTYARPRD
ncbi:MAG TPA: LuxR C-terminal-related transcriptional regulator [Candidatus Sulfotelmatobacter sp.]|nr:LuxR C-terminal-related transcriptional regulator [Candidatus Sulfotelmatobacter sp.]